MVINANETQALKGKDYKSDIHPDWCPGCGDFGIVNVIQQTFAELKFDPDNVLLYSGVGCSSKTPHFVRTYGVHTLHGRSLPFAVGSKLANDDLNVVVCGGDGDGYGIGAGHFLNTGRRNMNMTYIVYDNGVYGLTKGQASPTLKLGQKPKSLPLPNPNEGINPLAVAISAGYTFVARSYSFNAKHLKETLKRAMMHKGMSIVDVLQPCPTYNNLTTKEWYAEDVDVQGVPMPRVYDVEAEGYSGKVLDPGSEADIMDTKIKALARVQQLEERIPLGVFYQVELPTYYDRAKKVMPALNDCTTAKRQIMTSDGTPTLDLSDSYAAFRTDGPTKLY